MSDETLHFSIVGEPKSLARPVVGRSPGRTGRAWLRDPKGNKVAKERFRDEVRRQMESPIFFGQDVPILVDISFHMVPPQYLFVNGDRTRGRFKADSSFKWPKKPDVDNLDKFVLDALQGLVFHNDSQVVQQRIQKTYDRNAPFSGRTEVSIKRAPQDYASLLL